jgi:hypothetical protein
MSKRKSTKNESRKLKALTWDDLIDAAEENLKRNKTRVGQLEATIRYFQGRKEAGERCPATVN